ncbi:hypothetical protein [Halanaerobaculum tunisiense]
MLEKFFSGEDNWAQPKTLLLLGLAGMVFILLGDFTGNFTSSSPTTSKEISNQQSTDNISVEEKIEGELEQILSSVANTGQVQVDVTLDTGVERIYARDNNSSHKDVVEEDEQGGTRKTVEKEVEDKLVVLNQGGSEEAVVKKKIKPKIRGVLIVAEGAHNSYVKAKLIKAVKVGLGVPSYKISVLPKER